jgi:hypothetical protein
MQKVTKDSFGGTKQLVSDSNNWRPTVELSLFDRSPGLLLASMVVIFLFAGIVRLYKLKAPGLLVSREYTSAIIARDYYFEHTSSVEGWRKEIAHITRQNQPVLEPPVTEYLVSLVYRAVNREEFWFARFLTSAFWLVGGIFLYEIAKRAVSTDAAVFVTAFYLLNPLGVLLSRSFQPDSLMMMLFIISLFSLIKFFEKPSISNLVITVVLSGLTLLYRPLVLFTFSGAFVALAVYYKGTWRGLIDKKFLAVFFLSLLPLVLYYGYGVLVAGFLSWKIETSFRPWLLSYKEFWMGWLDLAIGGVGYTALIAGLLGVPLLRRGLSRALIVGMGVGYVVFGLVFTMHIHTHGYYQAQLIPIVAISMGPLVSLIAKHLEQTLKKWYWWLPVMGVFALIIYSGIREVRSQIGNHVFESEQTARQIGQIVNHSSQTVLLAYKYGLPLQYYGEFAGAYWPERIETWLNRQLSERELSVEERLDNLGFNPEYFVITDFNRFNKYHSDLEEFLINTCVLLDHSDEYLIYENCTQQ